ARASVKFSRSQAGTDAFRDAEDGLVGVSFGYVTTDHTRSGQHESGAEIRKFAATGYEISLVAIPADTTVGVGRSHTQTMNTPSAPTAESERSRISDINLLARKFNVPEADVDRHIAEGLSVDAFRAHILESRAAAKPIATDAPLIGGRDFNGHIQRNGYSVLRVVRSFLDETPLAGIEKEAHEELKRRNGGSRGVMIPLSQLVPHRAMQRALSATYSANGGFLAGQHVSPDIIEFLRPSSQVIASGARLLQGITQDTTFPKVLTGSAATWVAEGVDSAQSEPTFGQVAVTKKCLSVYGQISKELIMSASVDAENLVRTDFMDALGEGIDYAALAGTGSAGQPLGIMNTTGINTVTFGAAPSWGKVVEFEQVVAEDNTQSDGASFAWIATPAVRAAFKKTPKVSGQAVFLWEEGDKVNGYSARVSTNMPAGNRVVFGKFSELLVALFGGGLDVVIDPYTLARKRLVAITATQWADIAIRHPVAFAVSTDSGAQ
ncbi:MAG: phage major capsid protein, partial [Verrucomicrobia bacterium]|nr:phage major capsid protein [Verrucomicrobiota bacterium]